MPPSWNDFKASDGETLRYQLHAPRTTPYDTILLLIHGFTGSSDYFERNFDALSEKYLVVAPDLRGHGSSTKAKHGYHVSRLAADLQDFIAHLSTITDLSNLSMIGVGCSLGAAVLWSYTELFSSKAFSGMVFVDQALLQEYIPGSWTFDRGAYGVNDSTSIALAQADLRYAPDDFYRGLVQGCLAYRYQPTESEKTAVFSEQAQQEENFFLEIGRKGNAWWFGKLIADHVRFDHRDTMKLVQCPSLIMAGKRSGCFPVKGVLETALLINEEGQRNLATSVIMESGHCKFSKNSAYGTIANRIQGCIMKSQLPGTNS
jgi:pimeloyl-ACP methyl ester carboxylesterase